MALRSIPAKPSALPIGSALARHLRRPGDLHDAVEIPQEVREAIEVKARAAAIPAPLATALLLELHLLEADFASASSPLPSPPEPVVRRRLSAAHARYLRALTWRRQGSSSFTTPTIALPVRLLARASEADLLAASRGDLESALAWEAAAVAAGRSMTELVLLVALMQQAET